MKIGAAYYYVGVAAIFLIASFFALGSEYFNYMPFFYLLFGFGGSILRYTDSVSDLNTHLKIYHRELFNEHAIKWTFAHKTKRVYPTAVFSTEIKNSDDVELKEISHRVKMNLIFLVASFVSFPILTAVIMSWR